MCATDVSTALQAPGWRDSTALLWSHQQLAATAGSTMCGPTGGLQASSRLLCQSIQPPSFFPEKRWRKAILSNDCTLQPLSLSSKPKHCCCWQEVCAFEGKGKLLLLRGRCLWVSSSTVGSSRLQSVATPWCWRCKAGLKAVLCNHCSGREERGPATAGEAGCRPWWLRWEGGIVNPNPALTAVEVRPPCTIYSSRV